MGLSDSPRPDDATLLAAWRAGDSRAGNTLFNRHAQAICRFFKSKAPEAVEDLVQRTFLGCIEATQRTGVESFRPFLFGIARNQLYLFYRRSRRVQETIDFARISVAELATSPSQALARRQEHQLLMRALREIPLDFQVALELYYWEGLKGPQLAAALGIPANTVRSRLSRGRAMLRTRLEKLEASAALVQSTMNALETETDQLRALLDGDDL